MITSSGAICDVCGKYILPIDPDEKVHEFSIKGLQNTLHCDNACKELIQNSNGDWTVLPTGPLRKVFEEHGKTPATSPQVSALKRGEG